MSSRAEQLANRRRTLQLRCALQRQEVAVLTRTIESKLSGVDRLLDIAGGLLRNPLVVAAGAVGVVLLKPWRIFRFAGQGWLLWSLVRRWLNG